jgi:hypothetical protein
MQIILLGVGDKRGLHMERNWKEYNEKLVERGTIYIDPQILRNWNKELGRLNRGKEGHQFEYPATIIMFFGLLKVNFHLPYRQTTGFIKSISVFCPSLKKIPDYTTLFRRMNGTTPDLSKSIPKSDEPLFISVDASGLKADRGGTWIEKRFGRKKRSWLKIHFAIDVKTKRIIELSVTTDKVHDNRRFRGIVRRASRKHNVGKVAADPAYDDYKNYELLHRKKIRSAIKPRRNSNPDIWSLHKNERKLHRLKQVLLYRKYSYKTWKKKTGYNYRTLSESCFSAFKANYGDGVYSRKFRNARNEVLWKAYAYNLSR